MLFLLRIIITYGLKETANILISGFCEGIKKTWEEDIINGDARSRGEVYARVVIEISLTVLQAKIKAPKKVKGNPLLDEVDDAVKLSRKAEVGGKEILQETAEQAGKKANDVIEEGSKKVLNKGADALESGTVANTLTDAQKSRLNALENTINDHLTDGDFSGNLRDLQGNPVPNGRGGYFDHLGEMQDSYKSLQKIKKALEGSLKNPNLSDVDRALLEEGVDKANAYINKIEELFDYYGGIK